MSYASDPGGVFASDTHRRVLAHTYEDEAQELHPLGFSLQADPYHEISHVDDLEDVLKDLEADGYVTQTKSGWKMTKAGRRALAESPPEASGESGPALIGGLEGGS